MIENKFPYNIMTFKLNMITMHFYETRNKNQKYFDFCQYILMFET